MIARGKALAMDGGPGSGPQKGGGSKSGNNPDLDKWEKDLGRRETKQRRLEKLFLGGRISPGQVIAALGKQGKDADPPMKLITRHHVMRGMNEKPVSTHATRREAEAAAAKLGGEHWPFTAESVQR
jgi:hypothetical protein